MGLAGCTVVSELQRPSICIEEIAQEGGGFKIGRQICNAILFTSRTDPFDICGMELERFTLIYYLNPQRPSGDKESWRFHNARIALMSGAQVGNNNFVMVFESFEKVD